MNLSSFELYLPDSVETGRINNISLSLQSLKTPIAPMHSIIVLKYISSSFHLHLVLACLSS